MNKIGISLNYGLARQWFLMDLRGTYGRPNWSLIVSLMIIFDYRRPCEATTVDSFLNTWNKTFIIIKYLLIYNQYSLLTRGQIRVLGAAAGHSLLLFPFNCSWWLPWKGSENLKFKLKRCIDHSVYIRYSKYIVIMSKYGPHNYYLV